MKKEGMKGVIKRLKKNTPQKPMAVFLPPIATRMQKKK